MKFWFARLLTFFLFSFIVLPLCAQTISSVNPDSAYQGQQNLQVSISGSNLNFTQASSVIMWLKQGTDSIPGYYQHVNSENSARSYFDFSISAALGFYDVYCINVPLSQTSVLPNGFEILVAQPTPGIPVLISPFANEILNNNLISFDWTEPLNAYWYELIVDDDASFTSPIIHQSNLQTSSYANINLPFPNGAYFWKVRARNISEISGNWSATNSFTVNAVPLITSVYPDSGYQGQQELQVTISGENLSFTQASSVIMWLKQGTDSIPGYYQHVISVNSARSYFDFSISAVLGLYDVYSFNVPLSQTTVLLNGFEILAAQPAPGIPVLISPSDNSTLDNTIVSFDWNDPLTAYRYELIVDDDASFASPVIHQLNLQNSNYSNLNLSMNNGLYYWKVRAKNVSEIWGNWSAVNLFTINAIPQLIAVDPDNGYRGQTNLGVNISGVNTHFQQTSSTTDYWLQQQSYTIYPASVNSNSNFNLNMLLNIPGSAPIGYYDLNHRYNQDTITFLNAFYVHENNEFSGTIFIDANNNQVYDIGEVPYSQGIISISSNPGYSFSQSNGYFIGYAPAGNFTFTFTNPPSSYYTLSPSQHSATFTGTGNIDSGNDFALYPTPGIHDLRITVTNNTPIRQGTNCRLTLTSDNIGTNAESGNISLTFPSSLNVVTSSNSAYTISGNTITWTYTGSDPFNTVQITVDLFVPVSVTIGTLLDFTAQVSGSAPDTTPADNIDILYQVPVGPYDPNIKEVFPAAGLTPQQVADGEYLEYTIHFQNVGTADAINIRILDTLNPFLDITTFEVISASHPWEARLLDNRLCEFRFDNINLPDSNANELLSHGFIKYRIKPTSAFGIGHQIENTAHIYFDFNEAIVTNTTVTNIITGVEEQTPASLFNLFVSPNPFNGQTTISYTIPQLGFINLKLYNSRGQLIRIISSGQQQAGNQKLNLNMAEQPAGVYFISLSGNAASELKKLVLLK